MKIKRQKTEDNLRKILQYLRNNTFKRVDIEELLGIKGTRASELLNHLIKEGKIEAKGGYRDRLYKLRMETVKIDDE